MGSVRGRGRREGLESGLRPGEASHPPASQGHRSGESSCQTPPAAVAGRVGAGQPGPPAPASAAEGLDPGQLGLPSPGGGNKGQLIPPPVLSSPSQKTTVTPGLSQGLNGSGLGLGRVQGWGFGVVRGQDPPTSSNAGCGAVAVWRWMKDKSVLQTRMGTGGTLGVITGGTGWVLGQGSGGGGGQASGRRRDSGAGIGLGWPKWPGSSGALCWGRTASP